MWTFPLCPSEAVWALASAIIVNVLQASVISGSNFTARALSTQKRGRQKKTQVGVEMSAMPKILFFEFFLDIGGKFKSIGNKKNSNCFPWFSVF